MACFAPSFLRQPLPRPNVAMLSDRESDAFLSAVLVTVGPVAGLRVTNDLGFEVDANLAGFVAGPGNHPTPAVVGPQGDLVFLHQAITQLDRLGKSRSLAAEFAVGEIGDREDQLSKLHGHPPETVLHSGDEPVAGVGVVRAWHVVSESVTMGQTDDDAIDNMMNAGAAAIQNQLGIDTGEFAAMYFSGEDIAKEMKQIYRLLSDGTQSQQSREQTAMRLSEIFLDYARSEIAFAQREAGGDPDASGQERKQFFVLQTVEDDLPTLHGPFLTWDAMLEAAKALFAESPEDVLMHIEVPRGVEPRIDCFTDAMLESTEPFIKAMAEGLRQGEPVITRLKVQGVRYFTGQYEGEEIIINDDIADMLAQELGETIYVVEELTQEVAMMGRHAMQRFPESDWIEAAKAGKTLQGLHTWRLEQLDTLTKLASCK